MKVYENVIRKNWFKKIKAYFQFVLTNIYLTYDIFVFNKSCSFLSLDLKKQEGKSNIQYIKVKYKDPNQGRRLYDGSGSL